MLLRSYYPSAANTAFGFVVGGILLLIAIVFGVLYIIGTYKRQLINLFKYGLWIVIITLVMYDFLSK